MTPGRATTSPRPARWWSPVTSVEGRCPGAEHPPRAPALAPPPSIGGPHESGHSSLHGAPKRRSRRVMSAMTPGACMTITTSIDDDLAALLRRDPARLADPYPVYHRLRDAAPFHRRGAGAATWTLT